MLCSSAAATAAVENPTTTTTTNWLDRLHSIKDLPTAATTADDDYNNNNNNNPADAAAPSTNAAASVASDSSPISSLVTDVLSELFNIGSPRFSRKKFPRKQTNPKHCSLGVRESEKAAASLSSDNKRPTTTEIRDRRKSCVEEAEEEKEENGEKEMLVGFSRSEVTVIDTSFEVWKFEKLVFRRKSVWKVRDKKGKSCVVGRKKKKKKKKKKREGNVTADDDDEGGSGDGRRKKKMRVSSSVLIDNVHALNPRRQIEKVPKNMERNDVSQVSEKRQADLLC